MLADTCGRPNLTENANQTGLAEYDDLGVYDIDLGPVMLVSFNAFLFLESRLTISSVGLVSRLLF